MSAPPARHWDVVYAEKDPAAVSWYEPTPVTSLRLVRAAAAPDAGPVVDVGAGASSLADALLADGYRVTVLDVSAQAVAVVRRRLGKQPPLRYEVADVLAWEPTAPFAVWHDRAVLHFMTEPEQQQRYARAAAAAVRPGGAAVIGAFAPDGPTASRRSARSTSRRGARCSR